jgi:hypothetical protein
MTRWAMAAEAEVTQQLLCIIGLATRTCELMRPMVPLRASIGSMRRCAKEGVCDRRIAKSTAPVTFVVAMADLKAWICSPAQRGPLCCMGRDCSTRSQTEEGHEPGILKHYHHG